MADYHMLGDNMYNVAGNSLMEETSNMVNAGSYSHAAPMNVSGMMSQNMRMASSQNAGTMMQGMVPLQQQQSAQTGSQLPPTNMGSYHQGTVHGFSQSEVPQKLHQYTAYGSSQMQSGSAGGQYMAGGPRLHHMGDSMTASASPDHHQPQQQQPAARTVVPNQMAYQSRTMSGSHYGQQHQPMVHTNAASAQMSQSPAQYPNQYVSVPHHQYQQQQQNSMQQQQQQQQQQQVNQNTDLWQGSMNSSHMPVRQCMPQTQTYPQHQSMMGQQQQHGSTSLSHNSLTMQSQKPSTPSQNQYLGTQEYTMPHPAPQAMQMQQSSMYNLNSSAVNQNGTHMSQAGPPQGGMSQGYGSMPQTEQGMTYPQGHYASQAQAVSSRPLYNPSNTVAAAASGTVAQSSQHQQTQQQQQHLVAQQQQMMGMRPSMHQMVYSPVSSRMSSGQQHSGALPPGSPARVQQYHSPFSPNQGYPTSTQPSPRSVAGETATPPHMPHYSQSVVHSPTSPQYRGQFPPSQLTQSPQHLAAATPPAEASAPTSSCTPDRSRHSTPVPQSQGSFPSPGTAHMASPGQGHSPGNSSAPSSSLQHLEQMVIPHVGPGHSTTSNAPVVTTASSTGPTVSHSSGTMSGGYYSHHIPPAQQQQQQLSHMPSTNDSRPQPPAVLSHTSSQMHTTPTSALTHITQAPVPHPYPGQSASLPQHPHQAQQQQHHQPQQRQQQQLQPQQSQHPHIHQQSSQQLQPQSQPQPSQQQPQPQQQQQQQQQHLSAVNNVPNSQPVPPILSAINTLTDSSSPLDDTGILETEQCNSTLAFTPSVSNDTSNSGADGPNIMTSDMTNISQNSVSPSPNILSPSSNSAPSSHLTSVPPANSVPIQSIPHAMPKIMYQGSMPPLTYSMQQIQQEIQQLHAMPQTPENQEKLKNLQERLRYLQSQQSMEPGPVPSTVTVNAPSPANKMPQPQYPRPPMHYGSGKPMSYMQQHHHQQQQAMHAVPYGPQAQPAPVLPQECPMPALGPQPQHVMNDMYGSGAGTHAGLEPEPMETNAVPENTYMAHGPDGIPTMTASSGPGDPYEPSFNEEPPKKMKRKSPKEPKEPKEPKPPKEKTPKPKKPKKPKGESAETFQRGFIGPLPEGYIRQLPEESTKQAENTEGSENQQDQTVEVQAPPADLNEPVMYDIVREKKKKGRKRKNKDSDTPSSETKESKPKKCKKKSTKQPKKEAVDGVDAENAADADQAPCESGDPGEGVKEDPDAGTGAEGGDEDKKDAKTKSPKSSSAGKESKKSTPKKKLPKIALKFTSKKKKKKQIGSPDNSDLDQTPPPSPEEVDGTQKRRSARNTNRKKYTDDIDLHLSDETVEMDIGQSPILGSVGKNVQVVMESHNEDHMVVEKILAMRTSKQQPQAKTNEDADNSNSVTDGNECEEFFVKYKNLSYIHCEWKTFEELEKGDKRVSQKIKRFKQKRAEFNIFDFLEDEPFNPDYVEVDRVLDVNEVEEPIELADEANTGNSNSEPEKQTNTEESKETTAPSDKDSAVENDLKLESKEQDNVDEESVKDNENAEKNAEVSEELPKLEGIGINEECSSHAVENEAPKITADVDAAASKESDKAEESSKDSGDVTMSHDAETRPRRGRPPKEGHPQKEEPKVQEPKKNTKIVRHYLVKWRGLTYEESTWELEEDVDRNKIEQFQRFRKPPPKEKWKAKKRPKPSEWVKLEESPVYKGGNTLREYQLEGVNWLTFCWYNGQNCILADEMGLGKTIQSIAFLNEVDKYGICGPFLVIAPLSTIGNWQREFETWTDINAITYHGSSPSRNMIMEYEMYWKNEKGDRIQEIYKFQVLITTFEIILTDCMELKAIPWRVVIIDEAHRLKNRNCKLLEGLRLLNTEHRVLLTGTPLQNNVEELFSLLNFLEPSRFASTEAFLEEFGDLKTEAQVDKLKALLKPMMLRRLKEDVEKSLAPKEETVIEVELTNIQKKYYRAILERNFTFLTKGNCYSNIPNLMNTMMELRKCCIHPFLITGAEEQIVNDYKSQHEDCAEAQLNAMVQASGKLVLIDKLLPRLRADGHRVLVFSQMVKCLDILEDYVVQKRYPYERLDGRVRGNLRQAAIDRFCKPDSDRFVFLLCTRAGGLGINLTAADTVIIFDSDWNPQNDLQAQARCHRIGQSKAVKVYRLICRNTYEREMFDKASLKLGLDKAVLQSMCPSKEGLGVNQQMSKKEIEDLLRKGAYGALMEDDNAGDKFCEEDIDQILLRRTQIIHLESGTQGSTFSKATFASASTRSDIEIDDPNFWEKWAKKANLDVDELKNRNELIIQEPRRRTQTRRFGTDDNMLDLTDLETSDEDEDSISTRTRASKRSSKLSRRPKNRGRALDREKDDEYTEEIAPGNWTRAECFKVEKGLLTFGWGRWDECIAIGQFRRRITHKDCEHISRTILLYCLLHYKGDEKIKSFIWDLICPTYDGEEPIHRNHSEVEIILDKEGSCEGLSGDEKGLSAPVPRGRKGKKIKKEVKAVDTVIEESEWAKEEQYNPDVLLNDEAYRKHLNRHANKVLLRVRLLYYLKHEIIRDLHDQVFANVPASLIPLEVPLADGEPPALWWDQEVDKSLLLGIYKHGFERYNLMRQDPNLIFLSRCGPPDGEALLKELKFNEDELAEQASQEDADKDGKDIDKEVDELDEVDSNEVAQTSKIQCDNSLPSSNISPEKPNTTTGGIPVFPSVTEVNTRVRRLVTAYQRNNKKLEIKNAQRARKMERRERFEAAIRERELKKRELQQRKWSRREEADFYRTISSFGIEYTEDKKDYNWSRFRNIARLDRKFDETLAEYYKSFYAMCKRVCGKKLTEEEEQLSYAVDPISEERASRCLQRVDLLHKIREEILVHPELDERLKLCQPSMDLPEWWICGKHDKDLLIGAAKHGLSRMDYHLLHDPTLSFAEVLKNYPQAKVVHIGSHISTPIGCYSPITTCHQVEEKPEAVLPDLPKEEPKSVPKDEIPSENTAVTKEIKAEPGPCKDEEMVAEEAKSTESEKMEDEPSAASEGTLKDEAPPEVKEEKTDTDITKEREEQKEEEEEEESTDVEKTAEVACESAESDKKPEEPLESQPEEDKDEEETDIETDIKHDEKDGDDEQEKGVSSVACQVITSVDKVREVQVKTPDPPVLEEEGKCYLRAESETDQDIKTGEETDKDEKSDAERKPPEFTAPPLDAEAKIVPKTEPKVERSESVIKEVVKEEVPGHVEDSMECGASSQNDEVMSQASFNLEHEVGEPTVAQLLALNTGNIVRWPKDKVLQIRLEHIVQAVEKNEWPVIRPIYFPAYPSGSHHLGLPVSSVSVIASAASLASSFALAHTPTTTTCVTAVTTTTTAASVIMNSSISMSSIGSNMTSTGVMTAPLSSRTATPSPHRASPAPSVASREGHSREPTPLATPESPPVREPVVPEIQLSPAEFELRNRSPMPQLPQPTPSSSSLPTAQAAGDLMKHRRRRRRRRFEIEAERAKLRQLLSHNMQQQQQHHQQQLQHVQQFLAASNAASLLRSKMWEEHSEEKVPMPCGTPSLVHPPPPPPSLPPVTSSSASIPPPAHQNSSPRLSTTLGSLDLRVKSSATPPASFPTLMQPPKAPTPVVEDLSKPSESPVSPIDLSASAFGTSGQGTLQQGSGSSSTTTSGSSKPVGKAKEGRSTRGGSRIDALALNLQARKQQQLMQEQHHTLPGDSQITDRGDKTKELSESEETICSPAVPVTSSAASTSTTSSGRSLHHHQHHHHHLPQHHTPLLSEKRSLEEEEAKLRRKRLQFSEEAVRKSLNRAFEMSRTAPPAHSSSFLNSSLSAGLPSTSRLHLGSKHEEQQQQQPQQHTPTSNPLLDHSGLMHHDFKKWLEEHPELVATNPNLVAAAAAAMAFNPLPTFPSHTELLELPEGRRRGRRPRMDPTKLDYDKITGEENVSVINRLTGKKITGSKAPPLKHLAEWLDKNPMFDVDPKWGPLVREKGNLPNSMMSRIVTPSEKRGRRTAASLLASAHQNLITPPSTMSFPSASSLNPLSFANTGMLTGFPNMNFFKDPPKITSTLTPSTTTTTVTSASNPPLFLPFGGLAGMGLTNPLFGFPGFNFPGLQSAATSLGNTSLPTPKDQPKESERRKSDKADGGSGSTGSSSRKNLPASTSSSASASSIISGSGLPSATSLPFLYPTPGLLYNPLGLGSFTLPPNLPASFASFTQSGLVNGLGLSNPLMTTSTMSSTAATALVSSGLSLTVPATSHTTAASLSSISPHKTASSLLHQSSKHSPSRSSAAETQDTDEESLKSLMGTHDDDDDDLDENKSANYDNLDKDDSDGDVFRDSTSGKKSPASASAGRSSTKASESESECTSVTKSSFRASEGVVNSKLKSVSDEPASDSTDTESKAS